MKQNQKKQEAARRLYFSGCSGKEISEIIKISERTISNWNRANRWREKRNEKNISVQKNEERIMALIEYQLGIIERITEQRKIEAQKSTDAETLERSLIQRADIDALQKLFSTIKTKETSFEDTIKIIRKLTGYFQENNPEIVKDFSTAANQYINHLRTIEA